MRIKEWARLDYQDPERILIGLRAIALKYPIDELPYEVAALRTRDLRSFGEGRQCAIFCYGMGQKLGLKVSFAHVPGSDYDCIARYRVDDAVHYVPVQMKEFVPAGVNQQASLQGLVDDVKERYKDSRDLIVAVHLNRAGRWELRDLRLEGLAVRGLWFFAALSADQAEWTVMGDFLKPNPGFHDFRYPGL